VLSEQAKTAKLIKSQFFALKDGDVKVLFMRKKKKQVKIKQNTESHLLRRLRRRVEEKKCKTLQKKETEKTA